MGSGLFGFRRCRCTSGVRGAPRRRRPSGGRRTRIRAEAVVLVAVVLGRVVCRRSRPGRTAAPRRRARHDGRVIRPLNPETDAAGVVELIHEVFPAGTTTPESWLQQHASIPPRARHAAWVAIVDGTVAARAEAGLKWFSDTGSAFAGVSVHPAFRRRGIGSDL